MLIWYDLVWNNNLGYVRLNGSYNILKSINFQVAGIPSLCKEKNMNMKSMSYTGKVLWTVWELDVEDYEILFILFSGHQINCHIYPFAIILIPLFILILLVHRGPKRNWNWN